MGSRILADCEVAEVRFERIFDKHQRFAFENHPFELVLVQETEIRDP